MILVLRKRRLNVVDLICQETFFFFSVVSRLTSVTINLADKLSLLVIKNSKKSELVHFGLENEPTNFIYASISQAPLI